jgi:hypothetical protein
MAAAAAELLPPAASYVPLSPGPRQRGRCSCGGGERKCLCHNRFVSHVCV